MSQVVCEYLLKIRCEEHKEGIREMAKTKEEKLKNQLALATKMYKEFIDGGQLSQKNLSDGEVDGIGFLHYKLKDGLDELIRILAYRLHMEKNLSEKPDMEESEK